MSIIAELWYGNLAPMENSGKGNSGFQRVTHLFLRNGQALEEALKGKEKELFSRYAASESEYLSLSNEQAFRDGFSVGVKLVAEALCATQPEE